jgi:uncharacterized protein involved in exopolysaccharide biosynthesis
MDDSEFASRLQGRPIADVDSDQGISLSELADILIASARLLIVGPIVVGLLVLGITYLIAPTFTARTSLMPPQQQQSITSAALASLGALGGLAGMAGGIKSPADQYVALMQSTTVADRLIDKFKLLQVYDEEFGVEARRELEKNTRISVGRKDGLIVIEVDDDSPQRAADMANQYVEELRRLTSVLAISEAQQRRVFFEGQLKAVRDKLVTAQVALQGSGFSQGALRAEPKAAAESYARLRAEVTASEVRLQTLRGSLAESAAEVQQQLATLNALRSQLARVEQAGDVAAGPDYVSKYRDFKYQETLFELFARQYEIARVDESREGALIQVVDRATPPEKKSRPKRLAIAAAGAAATLVLLGLYILLRRASGNSPHQRRSADVL